MEFGLLIIIATRRCREDDLVRNLVCYLLATLVCSACFDPGYVMALARLKERTKKEVIVVSQIIDEQRHLERGFAVSMMPEEAQRMGAPTGPEFIELLNERINQKEREIGRNICEKHGYKMSSTPPGIGEYGIWVVDYFCNP